MISIAQRQQQIVDEFSKLPDWESRYKKIIEMGKALPELPAADRIEKNIVKGCQSQVWLVAELGEKGDMLLRGDSDALIVRGLVSLILQVYSKSPPAEILASSTDFLKSLGFDSNLSPSRANGLNSMLKQIYLFATAFDYLAKARGK